MNYEKDFVTEEIVDLKIDEYPKGSFMYVPTTAGEENKWINEYMKFDEETKKNVQDFAALNRLKLQNLKKVPYGKDIIKKFLNLDTDWEGLNKDQRWELISKLKPGVFDKIIQAIADYEKGGAAKKG